jgi:hypothetical protein
MAEISILVNIDWLVVGYVLGILTWLGYVFVRRYLELSKLQKKEK